MKFNIVRPNLRETNKELKRIGDLLEAFLLQVHGVRVKQEANVEPPEVSYASDDLLLKEEMEELVGKQKEPAREL